MLAAISFAPVQRIASCERAADVLGTLGATGIAEFDARRCRAATSNPRSSAPSLRSVASIAGDCARISSALQQLTASIDDSGKPDRPADRAARSHVLKFHLRPRPMADAI